MIFCAVKLTQNFHSKNLPSLFNAGLKKIAETDFFDLVHELFEEI
jgi:hypothetical protein